LRIQHDGRAKAASQAENEGRVSAEHGEVLLLGVKAHCFNYFDSVTQFILRTAVESLLKRHAAGLGTSESLCLVTRARLQSGRKWLKIKVGFSPCGNAGVRKDTCSDSPRSRPLNCSAPRQNGEIVNRCNHLRFEEDDQFNGNSTAAFRFIVSPGRICEKAAFATDLLDFALRKLGCPA
jgi:hypothetical protein